jgi:hypothetical protein
MKDNKLERVRQEVSMLRQEFLQSDAGVFGQVLGEQEITAMEVRGSVLTFKHFRA